MDRKVIGAAVAVVALAAGGCGSSSKPLTRAEFAQQGNAACRQAAQMVVGRSAKPVRGPEQFIERLLASIRSESDAFGKLKPPKELESTYAAFKQDLVQYQDLATRYLAAIKARDRAQIEAINRAATPVSQRRQAHLRALGLRSCS